jgi:hypothetical protein
MGYLQILCDDLKFVKCYFCNVVSIRNFYFSKLSLESRQKTDNKAR